MNDLQLRPAQAKILEYENGRLAISAVPGSGKTFTLSLLAAKLIGDGRIDPNDMNNFEEKRLAGFLLPAFSFC